MLELKSSIDRCIEMSSKLATFRISDQEWKDFQAKADEQGISASALLVAFVKWINSGNTLPKSEAELIPDIDFRIEERILQALSSVLPEVLAPLQAQLDELRGKLIA